MSSIEIHCTKHVDDGKARRPHKLIHTNKTTYNVKKPEEEEYAFAGRPMMRSADVDWSA